MKKLLFFALLSMSFCGIDLFGASEADSQQDAANKLISAIIENNVDNARKLIQRYSLVYPDYVNGDGKTVPLFMAVNGNQPDMVDLLLAAHANPNKAGANDKTPLDNIFELPLPANNKKQDYEHIARALIQAGGELKKFEDRPTRMTREEYDAASRTYNKLVSKIKEMPFNEKRQIRQSTRLPRNNVRLISEYMGLPLSEKEQARLEEEEQKSQSARTTASTSALPARPLPVYTGPAKPEPSVKSLDEE